MFGDSKTTGSVQVKDNLSFEIDYGTVWEQHSEGRIMISSLCKGVQNICWP